MHTKLVLYCWFLRSVKMQLAIEHLQTQQTDNVPTVPEGHEKDENAEELSLASIVESGDESG